jgi:ABC-type polysaccharide/polyol phosphate transport system ATPase subunit
MSNQHPAIELSDVTVAYRAYTRRPSSLKEAVIKLITCDWEPTYGTFNALSNISLTIPQGAVYAIVGSNGCGKSTLLKVIAGVLKPTKGTAAIHGSIASLIELGAGFDPELTAIENIYLHGSLHRKTRKEIEPRINAILDFAELHEFAHTPVKYYSSGMFARLGFSVAVDIDPDILLVDEILGVGDERFQEKCVGVFKQLIAAGKTIIYVTHSMEAIASMATHAVLLQKGSVQSIGSPNDIVQLYRDPAYQSALI